MKTLRNACSRGPVFRNQTGGGWSGMTVGELRRLLSEVPYIDDRYDVAVGFVEVGTECEPDVCAVAGVRLDLGQSRRLVFETGLVGLAPRA